MKKLLLTVFVLAALLLSGCRAVNAYFDDGSYQTGPVELTDKVESLEIEWASGAVEIVYGEALSVSETANRTLDERTSLQWRLDGLTLRIRYCEPERVVGTLNLNKTLTVTLPQDMALDSLYISSASADVTTAAIKAQTADIDTASGAVKTELVGCGKAEIDTASGAVEAALSGCKDTKIVTASGKVKTSLTDCETVSLETASGDIGAVLTGCGTAEIDTASGKQTITVTDSLRELSVDSASGDVTLTLPESLGFTAEVDTASGKFESELPVTMQGERFVHGDGAAALELDTASGDVTIKKFIG